MRVSQPSENASRSLTRALGLKVNRIVIDAGHGGHDEGTHGPNGLLEKDVVLDVALRLSKLVQSRLGADVLLTRSDDTFIPLEERTAIANARSCRSVPFDSCEFFAVSGRCGDRDLLPELHQFGQCARRRGA